MFRHRPRPRLRDGFSLMELVLVIAVLAMLGAVALPTLGPPLARQRLVSGGENVRGAWNNARASAMLTGEIHLFRYEPGTGEYTVQRMENIDTSTADTGGGGSTTASDEIHELPDKVLFVESDQVTSGRDEAALAEVGSAGSAPSILFYPDGTVTSVELELENEYGDMLLLSMRGLTGAVTMSDPYAPGGK